MCFAPIQTSLNGGRKWHHTIRPRCDKRDGTGRTATRSVAPPCSTAASTVCVIRARSKPTPLRARVERVPPGVGGQEQGLELLESRQRLMDLSGRPLVEICRRDQGLKLFLLRLEGFDACGQLLEFLLLFVGWLPLRSRRFLR